MEALFREEEEEEEEGDKRRIWRKMKGEEEKPSESF